MDFEKYTTIISSELGLTKASVFNTVTLLESGATIPFIARYRKEMTGSMDEVMIAKVRDRLIQLKDLDSRREAILKSMREQEKLTPELEEAVMKAATMAELEDIYMPVSYTHLTLPTNREV